MASLYSNFRFVFLAYAGFLLLGNCSVREEVIEIPESKDLIPEGLAIAPENGHLFLSSIHKSAILEFDPETGHEKFFIKSEAYGYRNGVGMTIKGHTLFALGSDISGFKKNAILLVFNINSGELLNKYTISDTLSHFWNDLAISSKMEIYISDTEQHRVYKLNYPDGQVVPFLEDETLQYPNGIAISDDDAYLYVDSWTYGIRVVDLARGRILNARHDATAGYGIDGLKYHEGALYAIHNGGKDTSTHGLVRIDLDSDITLSAKVTPLLVGHPNMNIPTTFDIAGNIAYILANSQLNSLDQERNIIQTPDSLTNTFIIKAEL